MKNSKENIEADRLIEAYAETKKGTNNSTKEMTDQEITDQELIDEVKEVTELIRKQTEGLQGEMSGISEETAQELASTFESVSESFHKDAEEIGRFIDVAIAAAVMQQLNKKPSLLTRIKNFFK